MIDIDAEFEKFFEFPTDDRSVVSSTSCKLFAEHVVETFQRSLVIDQKNDRKRFEKIISSPPYERVTSRYGKYSAWPSSYAVYDVQLCWDVCRDFAAPLHAEIEALKAKLEPDQFWMHDDPENSFATDLYSLIDNEYCNAFNSPDDFVGCEFRVMQSVKLHDITVKITGYKTNEEGEANEWLWEVA